MGVPGQRLIAAGAGASAALLANRALVDAETKPAEGLGGRVLDLPGGHLHVLDEGPDDGAPIVLLHGFAGSLRWFDRLVPLLGGRRILRVDALGHGGSEKTAGPYTIEGQAEFVARAMAALDFASAPVVGHSMGGAIAVALAESHPDRVDSLIVLDEGPDNSFGSQPLVARLGFVPVIGELMHRLAFDPLVKDGYKDAFGEGFEVPDHVVDDFRQMTYASYKGCWAGEGAYLDAVPLDERMRRLDLPRTVVFGDQDKFFDPVRSAEAFRQVDGVRVEVIDGVGHSPNIERPAAVAELVGQAAGAPA